MRNLQRQTDIKGNGDNLSWRQKELVSDGKKKLCLTTMMKVLALSFLSLSRLRGGDDPTTWSAPPLSGSPFSLPSTWRQGRRQLQIRKFPSIHHISSTRRCNQHRLLKTSDLFHLHLSANIMSDNSYNDNSGNNNRRDKPVRIKSVALGSSSSLQKESTHHPVNI